MRLLSFRDHSFGKENGRFYRGRLASICKQQATSAIGSWCIAISSTTFSSPGGGRRWWGSCANRQHVQGEREADLIRMVKESCLTILFMITRTKLLFGRLWWTQKILYRYVISNQLFQPWMWLRDSAQRRHFPHWDVQPQTGVQWRGREAATWLRIHNHSRWCNTFHSY